MEVCNLFRSDSDHKGGKEAGMISKAISTTVENEEYLAEVLSQIFYGSKGGYCGPRPFPFRIKYSIKPRTLASDAGSLLNDTGSHYVICEL